MAPAHPPAYKHAVEVRLALAPLGLRRRLMGHIVGGWQPRHGRP